MKRIIGLLSLCVLLSVSFPALSTQVKEYQYWHDFLMSVMDREPAPSYNILELEEPYSTASKMYYTSATISIDFTDLSLSLVAYRSDNELMNDHWDIEVGDLYYFSFVLFDYIDNHVDVYTREVNIFCTIDDQNSLIKLGSDPWYYSGENDKTHTDDPLKYLDMFYLCEKCGSIKVVPDYCWNCDHEIVSLSARSFLLLNEITWDTDIDTADQILRKNGFNRHQFYDMHIANPYTDVDGTISINHPYTAGLLFGAKGSLFHLFTNENNELKEVAISYKKGTNFMNVFDTLKILYGESYKTGYIPYEDYDSELYIWPLEEGYAVLVSDWGSIELAKNNQSSFSIYFYRSFPENIILND